MIRLNGAPSSTLRSSHSSNVPWLSRPVRSSVRARISTAWKTSAFWRAIETCAANSWTSSNSSNEKVLPTPRRSIVSTPIAPLAAAQRDDDQAAVVRVPVVAVVDPRVVALVADVDRLVVLDDPGRDAGLAGLPRLQVEGRVDAARGQRRQQPGRRIDAPRSRCCRRRSAGRAAR